MNTSNLFSLIGKSVYVIRNFHKGSNTRNFYIAEWKIENIIITKDGLWFNTGFEIFHESELGHRYSFDKLEIKKTLEYIKSQPYNKISKLFNIKITNIENFKGGR